MPKEAENLKTFNFALAHNQATIEDYVALDSQVTNLVQALKDLFEAKDWERVCTLMWILHCGDNGFLYMRGRWQDLRDCLALAVKAAHALGEVREEAAFAGTLAMLLIETGDLVAAEQEYRRILPIFEQLGKKHDMAVALHQLGVLASIAADYPQARSYFEQSLALKRDLDQNEASLASTLSELGLLAFNEGDLPTAHKYYAESLALKEKLGNQVEVAKTLGLLANLALKEGQQAKAEHLYKQAIEVFETFGEVLSGAIFKYNLALLYLRQDHLGKALPLLEEAVEKAERLGYYEVSRMRKDLDWAREQQANPPAPASNKQQGEEGILQKIIKFWQK